ncbi:uncharacterized protein CC84DRAFT_357746 [Paraphaeosphaeria sporulosa]|uniref:Uncharacterized protein n=1 Tax=Paraphaeosphaeria sporulosa TaxID=1460663 RepID=A0A177BY37_9PLEO|nr:uncharacterized protein CC84DRAFT_357746 [Paraphaeosphaeria sporulosa]OAG00046.1 hypothetical protein CC84DRAFT_357746 [Paraphaeosphaeria sporulosa]
MLRIAMIFHSVDFGHRLPVAEMTQSSPSDFLTCTPQIHCIDSDLKRFSSIHEVSRVKWQMWPVCVPLYKPSHCAQVTHTPQSKILAIDSHGYERQCRPVRKYHGLKSDRQSQPCISHRRAPRADLRSLIWRLKFRGHVALDQKCQIATELSNLASPTLITQPSHWAPRLTMELELIKLF